MDWRQIMKARGEQLVADRRARFIADQVKPKAEELFFLCRTITAIIQASDFATPPRSDSFTDRDREAVNNEDFAARRHFTQHFGTDLQPFAASVQAAVEARDTQVARQVVALSEYQQRSFVVILKILGGDDRDRQDFRITDLRKLMVLMTALCEQFIKNDKDRYNPFGVHRLLLKVGFDSTLFSGSQLMNAN
jgi:hypothetical protein